MRWDYPSFALGILGGLCIFVVIAVVADFRDLGSAQFCTSNETLLSCSREWADLVAIVAGFGAVFVVLYQMRHTDRQHREILSLQTFEMRALFARAIYTHIEPIEAHADEMAKVGRMWSAGQKASINTKTVWESITSVLPLLDQALSEVEKYDDGTLLARRDAARTDVFSAYADWHDYNVFGEPEPITTVTEDKVIYTDAASATCIDFADAFRKVNDSINRGQAPNIRQRLKRIVSVAVQKTTS